MRVTHNLRMDLARCSCSPVVNAVQGEANSRELIISLYDNGVAWEIPEATTAAVAFQKPDGLCGLYDQLPNGEPATSIAGSVVTAILAPQALTVPGEVTASVVFFDKDLDRLATFPFRIRVAVDPAGGQHVSNEYYNYSTMEEVNEAVDAALAELEAAKQGFLAKAEEALDVVHDAATEDAPAIVCEASGEIIEIADASNRPLQGLTLYGKTTQNGTPTPEAPVALESAGASGSIGVSVTGKNLFGGEALADKLVEVANATKDTEAGTVRYNAAAVSGKIPFNAFKENTRYTIIFYGRNTSNSSIQANLRILYADGTRDDLEFSTASELSYCVFTSDANKTVKSIIGVNYSNYTVLYYDKCGIFEGVLTEADFEPYVGQTLTVSTPNGMPGIDSFADEIDFARGVRVQRAYEYVVTGDETIGTGGNTARVLLPDSVKYPRKSKLPMLCNRFSKKDGSFYNVDGADSALDSGEFAHYYRSDYETRAIYFKFSTPMDVDTAAAWFKANETRVLLPLETPVETPLSAEELAQYAAQYAALHTYKPDTTVYNDSGAGMAVAYVADTKTYIDQKLAAISAAMLNA